MVERKSNIHLIKIFNLSSEDSLDIQDKNDIKETLTYFNNIKVRKKSVYLAQDNLEFLISTYDKEGEVIETFYLSKNKLVKYHWLLTITNDKDLYEFVLDKYNKIN